MLSLATHVVGDNVTMRSWTCMYVCTIKAEEEELHICFSRLGSLDGGSVVATTPREHRYQKARDASAWKSRWPEGCIHVDAGATSVPLVSSGIIKHIGLETCAFTKSVSRQSLSKPRPAAFNSRIDNTKEIDH